MGKRTGLAALCVALVAAVAMSACGGSSGSSATTERAATSEVTESTQETTTAGAGTTTEPPTPASSSISPTDEQVVAGDLVQLTINQLPAQDGNEWKSNIEIPGVLTLQGACAAGIATPSHSYESWASGSVNLTYQHVAFSSSAEASEAFDKLAEGTAPCEYDIGEGSAKQTWSLADSAPIADKSGAKVAQFRHSVGGVEVDTFVVARANTVAHLIFFGGPPSDSLSAAIFAAILGGGGSVPVATTLPLVSTSATGRCLVLHVQLRMGLAEACTLDSPWSRPSISANEICMTSRCESVRHGFRSGAVPEARSATTCWAVATTRSSRARWTHSICSPASLLGG